MSVDHPASANNDQRVRLVSHRITQDSDWFRVDCEFKITGTGVHAYRFDPAGMIAEHATERTRGKPMTNLLDYIRFKPQAGEYRYHHRSNDAVARGNALSFRRSAPPARMGIKLASLVRNAGAEGFGAGPRVRSPIS